jgi:hypothetical protein
MENTNNIIKLSHEPENNINLHIDDMINNSYDWHIELNDHTSHNLNNNTVHNNTVHNNKIQRIYYIDTDTENDNENDNDNENETENENKYENDLESVDDFQFNQIVHIDDDLDIKEIQINENKMDPNHLSNIKRELKDGYNMFVNLVNDQNNIRINILRQILSLTYVKPLKYNYTKIHPSIIMDINKMAEVMDLEIILGALIADILFDDKLFEQKQIKQYRYLISPFLISSVAQENFLNQMLIIFQRYQNLVEQDIIISIFNQIIKYNLVNNYSIINWYNCLIDEDFENDNPMFKYIDNNLKNAVSFFLTEMIDNINNGVKNNTT